jgi:hypothetical protein
LTGESFDALRVISPGSGLEIQVRAKASRLEHSSTRLAVVSARNPPETASWFCIIHLPLAMLVRID